MIKMKDLLKYLKPYRKQCIIGPFCKLMEAILELLLPTLMAYMINDGIMAHDEQFVFRYSIIMILMVMIGFAFSITCQYQAAKASQGFGTDVRNALFSHIMSFSYQDLDEFGTPSLVNRLSNDINQLQVAVAMLIRLVVRSPFIVIGAIIMAMFLDMRLAWILIATVPFIILILYIFIRWTTPMYQHYQKLLDKFSSILDDNFAGIRVIRSFVSKKREQKRFEDNVDELQKQMMRVAKLSALLNPSTALVINGAVMVLLYQGIIKIQIGSLQPGTIVAFINYASSILLALIAISNLIVIFTKAFASGKRVSEALQHTPSPSGNMALQHKQETVLCFDHVSFSYGKGDAVLDDVSFSIQKGETIGIIGGTGAGKTTLISLLCHFYAPTNGRIYLYGQDITTLKQADILSRVVLVPQIDELFSGTIEENICFGLQNVSIDEIQKALSISQAKEFVDELPEGIHTKLERNGANLSGGQKQRLCIARAIIRHPDILVLDDASSALDFKSDAALRRALNEMSNDMTKIMISQRVGTLTACKRILVMDNGRIAGFGSHKELYDSCDVYRFICESQHVGRDIV